MIKQLIAYHDEGQFETDPHLTEQVKYAIMEAWREAGEYYAVKVPIEGDVKIGSNWAETH